MDSGHRTFYILKCVYSIYFKFKKRRESDIVIGDRVGVMVTWWGGKKLRWTEGGWRSHSFYLTQMY